MANDFELCPKCGSKKIEYKDNRKWFCPDCGFDLYNNVAAAVGIIICDKNNNILLEVRAKDPQKGKLALPGGFIDPEESTEDAVIRECKEEIGVEIHGAKFLCSYPNTYEYKGITYKTCDIFFTLELPSEYSDMQDFIKSLKKQESEVLDFVSYKIKSQQDIDNCPLAFDSARNTLKRFIMEN